MLIFYNIIVSCLLLLIKIHSRFNLKSKKWIDGRKNIFSKIQNQIGDNKNIIWFHCASLGEYEQAKELIFQLKKKNKEKKILLTFFSSSGYENIKHEAFIEWIFYLPFDTRKNARKFVSLVKPEIAFFIKSEFWINYMVTLNEHKVPLYHISSVFHEKQLLIKLKFFQNQLKKSKHIFVQDQSSFKILKKVAINNVSVVGDTRIDSIISETKKNNLKIITSQRKTFVFGSVWPKDEHVYMRFVNDKSNEFNYLIAPHDLSYCNKLKTRTHGVLFSQIINNDISKERIIIIDNIGMLKNLYKYCDYAYIGGGFGKGIHNILEPAAYKLPIIFGPNYKKCKEAGALIKLGCSVSVKNYIEFNEAINNLKKQFKKTKTSDYLQNNKGAVNQILNAVNIT